MVEEAAAIVYSHSPLPCSPAETVIDLLMRDATTRAAASVRTGWV